jgi:hypothetical protein
MTNEEAVKVIDYTLVLLNDPSKWSKNSTFSEVCNEAGETFTLSCALKTAHHAVLGLHGYGSRTRAMERVRRMIGKYFLWRYGIHPITHFNRHKKTTYTDLIFILQKTRESFL